MTNGKPSLHRAKKGVELPIGGAPEQVITGGNPLTQVAVTAADFRGIRPRMAVKEGDTVKRGALLFEDRRNRGVRFTSPGAGTVVAIQRGERRALLSVVIALDSSETGDGPAEAVAFDAFRNRPVAELTPSDIRALLLEAGLFPFFRRRPFDKIPSQDETPRSIFVSAAAAHPLSPDPVVVLDGQKTAFETGLFALRKLAEKKVVVVMNDTGDLPVPKADGIEAHRFKGPFPFGTVGSAIHRIDPVDRNRSVWYLDLQSVVAVGHLIQTGTLLTDRVVALAGPGVAQPRLVRTRLGAAMGQLTKGAFNPGEHRVVSGSLFDGRMSDQGPLDYLGYYHDQITVIENGADRKLLGWLSPGADKFSVSRLFISKLLPASMLRFNTDQRGGKRTMVPVGLFERVWPFDLLVTPLLRALLAEDDETAEALGCLELSEEDVAVCSFVCPSKIDYGEALRATLTRIEEQG